MPPLPRRADPRRSVESLWLQGLIIPGRQRLRRGHGRFAGVCADHPAGAVRILHPIPAADGRLFRPAHGGSRGSAAPSKPDRIPRQNTGPGTLFCDDCIGSVAWPANG